MFLGSSPEFSFSSEYPKPPKMLERGVPRTSSRNPVPGPDEKTEREDAEEAEEAAAPAVGVTAAAATDPSKMDPLDLGFAAAAAASETPSILVGPLDFCCGQLTLEQDPALPLPRLCLRWNERAIDAPSIVHMLSAVDVALAYGKPFTALFDVRCASLPSLAHLKQISEWYQTRRNRLRQLSHGFAIVLSTMMTRSTANMILSIGQPLQPHAVFTKEADAFAFARDKCRAPSPDMPSDSPEALQVLDATPVTSDGGSVSRGAEARKREPRVSPYRRPYRYLRESQVEEEAAEDATTIPSWWTSLMMTASGPLRLAGESPAAEAAAPSAAEAAALGTSAFISKFQWPPKGIFLDGQLCSAQGPLAAFLHANGFYQYSLHGTHPFIQLLRVLSPTTVKVSDVSRGSRRRERSSGLFSFPFTVPAKKTVKWELDTPPDTAPPSALDYVASQMLCGGGRRGDGGIQKLEEATAGSPRTPGSIPAMTDQELPDAPWDAALQSALKRFLNVHGATPPLLTPSWPEWNMKAVCALQVFLKEQGATTLEVTGLMGGTPILFGLSQDTDLTVRALQEFLLAFMISPREHTVPDVKHVMKSWKALAATGLAKMGSSLDSEDPSKLRAVFDNIDLDKTGTIEAEEVSKYLASQLGLNADVADAEASAMIGMADVEQPFGSVDFHEFSEIVRQAKAATQIQQAVRNPNRTHVMKSWKALAATGLAKMGSSLDSEDPSKLRAVFDSIDLDKTGTIEAEEVSKYLASQLGLNADVADAEASAMIGMADVEQPFGSVDFHEFGEIVRQAKGWKHIQEAVRSRKVKGEG
jgi:Ca2+-binding EF-hand superfamily protein